MNYKLIYSPEEAINWYVQMKLEGSKEYELT